MTETQNGHGTPSEPLEGLQDLARYERPSGAPFRPSPGAPATHTGRPAQHSGTDEPIIMCPMSAVQPGVDQCPFIGDTHPGDVANHLSVIHEWSAERVEKYLADPWIATEPRSAWKTRTLSQHYSLNGGGEERALRCPVTIDCMHSVFPVSQIRAHLTSHGWTPTKVDDWLETQGVQDLPPLVQERPEALLVDTSVSAEDVIQAAKVAESMDPSRLEAELTEWWMDRAEEEVRRTVPKAVEYGSHSLTQLGRTLAQLQGREVDDEEALELGCWINAVQKMGRWTDSVMRGERCSDDSIYDLGVYVRMTQRIRDSGGWPGVPKD